MKEKFKPLSKPSLIFSLFERKHHQLVLQYLETAPFALSVQSIYRPLGLEQALVSGVLADYRRIGIVDYRRAGAFHLYAVNADKLSRWREIEGVVRAEFVPKKEVNA